MVTLARLQFQQLLTGRKIFLLVIFFLLPVAMTDGLPTKTWTTIRCSLKSVQIGRRDRHLENSIVVGFNCQRLLPVNTPTTTPIR